MGSGERLGPIWAAKFLRGTREPAPVRIEWIQQSQDAEGVDVSSISEAEGGAGRRNVK